jgi:AraC-like DNA-binding protein
MFQQTVKYNIPHVPLMASGGQKEPSHLGSHCSVHYHDEMEFLIVYQGEFVAIIDNKEYVAKEGEVIFINSGVPHTTSCDKENTYTGILQFRLKDFIESEIERIIRYSVKYRSYIGERVRVISSPEFFHSVETVITESLEKKGAYEMYIRSGIFHTLGFLYRNGYLADGLELYERKEVQKILPALTYINEHFAEDIDLDSVSTHLGFNPSYFCRIFKNATGATFTEYLNFVRVCKAERMLAQTQDSILEIAGSVGIFSVSYFNRIFKKYHNCSPSVYRQAQYTKAPI